METAQPLNSTLNDALIVAFNCLLLFFHTFSLLCFSFPPTSSIWLSLSFPPPSPPLSPSYPCEELSHHQLLQAHHNRLKLFTEDR